MKQDTPCPCGNNKPYSQCCGQYIDGEQVVPTAEALMRSRYTAFTQNNAAYLLKTWHSSTRPSYAQLRLNPQTNWLGLTIKSTEAGGENDDHGSVEFVARFKDNREASGKATRLYELSDFVKENGHWFYVLGHHPK